MSGAQIARQTNDVAVDGEVVWSWRPDAGAKFVESSLRMTVAKEPGHRGATVFEVDL